MHCLYLWLCECECDGIFKFNSPLLSPFVRQLTESKQAEFMDKARILMQLEKYKEAVSEIVYLWKLSITSSPSLVIANGVSLFRF